MAQKRFYLIKRHDRLTLDETTGKYKPTFYVRFRGEGGELLPWQSTQETLKTRAELWAQRKIKEGTLAAQDRMSFGTFALKWWTQECPYCEARIAEGTAITLGYRKVRHSYLDNQILPRFKDVELSKITTGMIETWKAKLLKAGELSPSTINHALRTLKIMLGEAVRLGLLGSDPSKSVRQLRETPEERGILTLAEIRALFDEAKIDTVWGGDYRHFALNMTAASCGLRLGEVLGLTAQHVHDDYLEIEQAWSQIDGLQDPKWHKKRLVPLPSRTSAALKRVIAESSNKGPCDLLFYGERRDFPIAHQVVLRRFYAALEAVGIDKKARMKRGIVFHSHRHGFNSYCRGKVPDELLRAVVGHADERMTERYFHPGLEAIKELAKVQERILG
jgi:integrase